MTVPKLRDERLCWLAVRDELSKRLRHRPSMLLLRLAANLAPTRHGLGEDHTIGPRKHKMTRYAFAVNDLAGHLTDEERQILRNTGAVPDWFLPAVRRQARQTRGR